ncbi:MAG: ferrous iron transport protein A [Clostridiaceae bacterium]|nr:ferrous iron transport protein A [Clostridiaceae bacterium]
MEVTTLDSLKVGQRAIVSSIAGGRMASKRLYEMGFNRGSQVRIIKNDIGPIIVCLAGSKIALGVGLARKIVVQPEKGA